MFEEILSKNAKESLALLGESELVKNGYLAGGTALALQLGHRRSYDFDFFTTKKFDEEEFLKKLKKLLPSFQTERTGWKTLLGHLGKTKFSYFYYQYPLLFNPLKYGKINLADVRDIAAMKIAAVSDRGTKRDFIDLYYIFCVKKIISIDEAIRLYDLKFKTLRQNKIHVLKSLSYFEDADQDIMPKMIEPVNWRLVKKYFLTEQKKLASKLLR